MQRTVHEDSWLLKASDFTEKGTTLTIDRVEMKEIAQGVEKEVVFFADEPKGFVLNQVNIKTIEKNTGETDKANWKGYRITLYATSILVKEERCPCIRIKFCVNRLAERVAVA
jgi:hypothetical protein